MENYNCPTGFLIAQDEQGNYVPFLIKVRDKELLWTNDSSNFNDDFLNKLKEYGCTNIIQSNPSPSYSFELDGWSVKIENGADITAVREFRFREIEEFFTLREEDNSISPGKKYYTTSISFPLTLLRKGLFISTTLNTTLNELKTATSNIILDDKFLNGESVVNTIGLSLSFMNTLKTIQGDVIETCLDDGVVLRSSCSFLNNGLIPNDVCGYDETNDLFFFDNTVEEIIENASSIFVQLSGKLANMKIFNMEQVEKIEI